MVVTAQGSLQPWALQKPWWKKALALWTYEGANLKGAACLRAVADAEVADYRRRGLRQPITVIPNGILIEWITAEADGQRSRVQLGLLEGRPLALFLSRITPKKGLPMLVQAAAALREWLGNWLFVIAGKDEFGHQRELTRLIHELGMQKYFRFVGALYGKQKRDVFAASDLFVLPTHSEGAPIAILEALGAGLPVLTTKGAPWPQLVEHNCGWWTEISAGAIQQALDEALSKSRDQLCVMGARGQELVRTEYLWKESAWKTVQLYQWVRGKRTHARFYPFQLTNLVAEWANTC
jgi:glycosyltransferase involved in cell wall biosynthesis